MSAYCIVYFVINALISHNYEWCAQYFYCEEIEWQNKFILFYILNYYSSKIL